MPESHPLTKAGVAAVAAMTAALLGGYVGSFIGDQGTVFGTGLGAGLCTTAAAGYEWALHRAKTIRLGPLGAVHKIKARVLTPQVLCVLAAVALVGLGAAFGIETSIEVASGSTMHGLVTGTPDHGTTLGGSSAAPPPPRRHHRHHRHLATASPSPSVTATPSVSPTPSSATLSPAAPPSLAPSPSPTPSPATTPASSPPALAPSPSPAGAVQPS